MLWKSRPEEILSWQAERGREAQHFCGLAWRKIGRSAPWRPSVDDLPNPAITVGPELAMRADRSFVVDPFFVRAANDAVGHHDSSHLELGDGLKDGRGDGGITAHVPVDGCPTSQVGHLLPLGHDDTDRHFARSTGVRPVEGDRCHGVSAEAAADLLAQALYWLVCLQSSHAGPIAGSAGVAPYDRR